VGYDGYRRRRGSKVHVAVSEEGLPLSVVIGPGDEHDSKRFIGVLNAIRAKRGIGRPKTRPEEVYADSAYDTREIRSYLKRRGIKANIPFNPRNTTPGIGLSPGAEGHVGSMEEPINA